jgi:hypothetical protein
MKISKTINLNLLSDIYKTSGRKYLNITKKEQEDIYYILSYIQLDIKKDIENMDYIKTILLEYIDYLNNKTNDKTLVLSEEIVPNYIR